MEQETPMKPETEQKGKPEGKSSNASEVSPDSQDILSKSVQLENSEGEGQETAPEELISTTAVTEVAAEGATQPDELIEVKDDGFAWHSDYQFDDVQCDEGTLEIR